ncbi:hypothetical protein XA68_12156 [Ophiocordyceps unilateralis]|uniref:Pentacotripeptide-repeat region of PRORP domain-containing protein n=1 Tax=Ophiocordyceps unilateralis TaxID=268505 RepID=A0A2A9PMZ1_OPHUN|nr:hypothetical protein XA68_12156 [Ophiocordyceps unilateralis]
MQAAPLPRLLSVSGAAPSRVSRQTVRPLSAATTPFQPKTPQELKHERRLDERLKQERRTQVSYVLKNFRRKAVVPDRKAIVPARLWPRQRIAQSLYKQWGYLRHQPPLDRRRVRNEFNSWKIELNRVLKGQDLDREAWLERGRFLFELDDVASMREAWEAEDFETRRQSWPWVMLSTIRVRPEKVSRVLDATLDLPPPGYAIHDVLLYVAQNLKLDHTAMPQDLNAQADEVLDLAIRVLEDLPAGHVPFGQRTFGILARELPCEQANELYSLLVKKGCKMHENTLLQFARKLAGRMTYKPTSLEILVKLADEGLDLNEAKAASVITSLLHCKTPNRNGPVKEPKPPFFPKIALERLVEKGLSPNVFNSTAFLDSLSQLGEVDESIRLALLFSECGVQLDNKSWVTVVRGAKTSLDVAKVVSSLDVAKAANAPIEAVLNYALHSVYYFANMESREWQRPPPWTVPLFEPLLELYAAQFNLTTLQQWFPEPLPFLLMGMPGANAPTVSGPQRDWQFRRTILVVAQNLFFKDGRTAGTQLQPNSTTLAIMIRAYICSMESPHQVMSYLLFFKAQLQKRTSAARTLLREKGSLIHDSFIMAMMERERLFRAALQLFGEMVQENTPGERDERYLPIHPAPSVITLALVVRGLMSRGERRLAEEVLDVMSRLGVRLNLVGWNTLLKGYASLQDMHATVATLQGLEAAGFRPDSFTLAAFGKLHAQKKALAHMQAIIDENRRELLQLEAACL